MKIADTWKEMNNWERGVWVRKHAQFPADGRVLYRWQLMELFKLNKSELEAVLKGEDYPER